MPTDPCSYREDRSRDAGPASLDHELALLYQRIDYERTAPPLYPRYFKLESMRRLLEELGNPHNKYRIVHVAGTKGKGSVCSLIAAGLRHSGIKTGRYSSPHIERINERIEIDGQSIADDELADKLRTVRLATERLDLPDHPQAPAANSFFEVITATALLFFDRQRVDTVVLEVGLGGRLDSTNVCQPILSVITNISLDHTRQLGTVVDKIAREKAGIIKPGIPVISGATDPLAAREIRESSSVHDSSLIELDRDFFYEVSQTNLRTMKQELRTWGRFPIEFPGTDKQDVRSYELEDVLLNRVGDHHAENAAVAIAALHQIGVSDPRINEGAIRQGMQAFALPGRCEVLCRHPLIVVDMAHNVASVEALIATLRQLTAERKCRARRLVFASSEDKDLAGMLEKLLPEFDSVVFTKFLLNPRATDPQELLGTARACLAGSTPAPELSVAAGPIDAWRLARPHPSELVCVAGSAFLVAEMRPLIREELVTLSPDEENPSLSGT